MIWLWFDGWMARPLIIEVPDADRVVLEARVAGATTPRRDWQCARIVLMAGSGVSSPKIAAVVGICRNRVDLWKRRYVNDGLDGLVDQQRSRRPADLWAVRTVDVGDDDHSPARGAWPEERQQSEGLYVDARGGATVTRGSPHPDFGFAGLADLSFASTQTVPGPVVDEIARPAVRHQSRRRVFVVSGPPRELGGVQRRREDWDPSEEPCQPDQTGPTCSVNFVEFLADLDRQVPAHLELHCIIDTLSAHDTPGVETFLDAHPRAFLHRTPTHASWLNQVEMWFSILTRQLLPTAEFADTTNLSDAILDYIADYNTRAKPFHWTYDAVNKHAA